MQFESPSQAVAAAIRAIFERWTALTLTIEHQCGGAPDRANQFLDATVSMAIDPRKRHAVQDFEDLFYAQFDTMDTDIEDGSPEQVATHIVRIRDSVAKGDFTLVVDAVQQSHISSTLHRGNVDGSKSQLEQSTTATDADDDEMNDDLQISQQPAVDEDGFTEVRRGRRNRQPPQRYTS